MLLTEIPFGHVASQASVNVHAPKPSLSIWLIIFTTRILRSGAPCGNNARCATLAERNNIALLFLQAATQAPQPIHAAAANEASALSFSTGIAFASTALPVFTEIKPPACMMRSNEDRSTIKSFMTGKAFARHGSTTIVSPSLYARMCNWHTVLFCHGPCGLPLIYIEHVPQIPSRQS